MLATNLNNSGLTTIEEARQEFNVAYTADDHVITKVQLKCWINHSESRNRNGNKPFTYDNYIAHMRGIDLAEQVRLDMIDISDIGDKEEVIKRLLQW